MTDDKTPPANAFWDKLRSVARPFHGVSEARRRSDAKDLTDSFFRSFGAKRDQESKD